MYKEKRNGLFKKEIEKEYLVKKEDNNINLKDSIDGVDNTIEEKSLLPSEIRENNIMKKFFQKISNVIKSIFS